MDKKTFLSELEKALSVLREDELRDILDEYAQHIDMKVERGLSEEEAISDFGSFSELTAEILEAYHVRQDYGKVYEEKCGGNGAADTAEDVHSKKLDTLQSGMKKGCRTLVSGCRSFGKGIGNWCRILWQWITAACLWCGHVLMLPIEWGRRLVRRMVSTETEEREAGTGETMEQAEQKAVEVSLKSSKRKEEGVWKRMISCLGRMCRRLWDGTKSLFFWSVRAALWCMRLFWNGCVILFALTVGFFGICCLFLLGMGAVLLAEGYPLLGVTIGGAGITVSTFAVVFFSLTLLIRKRRNEASRPESQGKHEEPKKMEMNAESIEETEEEVLPNA